MNDTQAAARLADGRATAVSRLATLESDHASMVEASADSNADDEHDPEGSTIAFERSQVETLISQTKKSLEEIDAALARIEEGTYGICENCGEPISRSRLEARLVARRCIECANLT